MSTVTPVRPCISADSHVTEPDNTYIDYIDPKFRDRAPRVDWADDMGVFMSIDNGRNRMPFGMIAAAGKSWHEISINSGTRWEDLHPGGYDPVARLGEQDRDGVVAEVIYPSVGMTICNHPEADYKKACFDAYNRWIAEFNSHAPERLIGLGQTAVRSVDEAIADLEAMRDLGLKGVMLPGYPASGIDYDHPDYDAFWEASVSMGMPLSFHILTSGNDHPMAAQFRGPKINSFLGIIRGNQDIIGTLIFGGVFERHPNLRVVCVEADAGWAPHWMYRADHAYNRHRNWLESAELSKKPSDYFRENVYLTFQDDWVAFKLLDLMNTDRVMWANDHPHSDATWPWSQEMLTEQTTHMTDHQLDRVLRDNCAELYGLTV